MTLGTIISGTLAVAAVLAMLALYMLVRRARR